MSESNSLAVPLTLEGASVLHQMFRVRWSAWKQLDEATRQEIAAEASGVLEEMERRQSALFSMLGHKGDLMLVHFRESFDDLNGAELALAQLRLADYLEPATSYLSVVELGLYDSTVRLHESLAEKGIRPDTPEWEQATEEVLAQQRKAMAPRLYPEIPARRYLSFYPMDKRRGEIKNWYSAAMRDRKQMMHEHGMSGRKFTGRILQLVTGSTGLDEYEWGVTLFGQRPDDLKATVYTMRYDKASAVYADFGPFYTGVIADPDELVAQLGLG